MVDGFMLKELMEGVNNPWNVETLELFNLFWSDFQLN